MARQWTREDNLQELLEAAAKGSPVYGHQAAVMELWYAINTALDEQGLTQSELAERAGLKQSYLSRVLSNPEKIGLRTAFRLCNALGLELVVTARPKAAAQPASGASRRPRSLGAADPKTTRRAATAGL
jgi:DNA-binding phage protein